MRRNNRKTMYITRRKMRKHDEGAERKRIKKKTLATSNHSHNSKPFAKLSRGEAKTDKGTKPSRSVAPFASKGRRTAAT